MKEEVELSNLISNCFFFFGGLLFIADGLTKNNKIWQFFNFATLKFKAKKKKKTPKMMICTPILFLSYEQQT